MSFTVIIPARYDSTRLPGKPLLDIAGKPMVQHVVDKALACGAKRVIVATDDQRIRDALSCEVCMTSKDHESGTERLAEVVNKLGLADDEIIVNVQGDEPLIPSEIIAQVANNLAATEAKMATLSVPITHDEEIFNPNAVKVVADINGHALYFSRASIPWDRDGFKGEKNNAERVLQRHIGIYAYRAGFINQYISWQVSPLEQIEKLEQLRVLWYGEKIHVAQALVAPLAGVDTEEDLQRVRTVI